MASRGAAAAACAMAAMVMMMRLQEAAAAAGSVSGGGGELVVTGRVYCDACRAGAFGKSSFFLEGAKVGVQCRSRGPSAAVSAYAQGVTDAQGVFRIPMAEAEEAQCVAMVLRSANPSCNLLTSQRSIFARVFLTRNAGLADNLIRTGPFAFQPARIPRAACAAELAAAANND